MKHPGGRPTVATPENVAKGWEYVEGAYRDDDELFPTVEGLSLYIGINQDTLHVRQEFSELLAKLKSKQARDLVRHGIKGEYSPVITKLLLASKHGYVEKTATDVTSGGEPIQPDPVRAAEYVEWLKSRSE